MKRTGMRYRGIHPYRRLPKIYAPFQKEPGWIIYSICHDRAIEKGKHFPILNLVEIVMPIIHIQNRLCMQDDRITHYEMSSIHSLRE
jgi:hypothetical protein